MSFYAENNESTLLLQVSLGDQQAFTSLFKKYSHKVYTLGMYLTKSAPAAEEIVQEVFIKVWQKRKEIEDINFFNSWLRVITKNTCYNYIRKLAAERLALSGLSSLVDDTPLTMQYDIELKETETFIEAAIQKLPPQQQKVFRLKKQSGKKIAEIAQELNISVYTVKEYLKEAQKAVKSNLEVQIDILILLLFIS